MLVAEEQALETAPEFRPMPPLSIKEEEFVSLMQDTKNLFYYYASPIKIPFIPLEAFDASDLPDLLPTWLKKIEPKWETLPAGEPRMIRANKEWLKTGIGSPWLVISDRTGKETQCEDVRVKGTIRFEHYQAGCLGERGAYLMTEGEVEILVK